MEKKKEVEKKTLKKTGVEPWEVAVIKFTYEGEDYSCRISKRLVLDDMGIQEVKSRLNKVVGYYAYWKSLRVAVERKISHLTKEYEIWFAEQYDKVSNSTEKKQTEGWIKNHVLLDNVKEYRSKQKELRDLQFVRDNVDVIVKAYDMQSWTLRSIANLVQSELGNIEAIGRGDLRNIKR